MFEVSGDYSGLGCGSGFGCTSGGAERAPASVNIELLKRVQEGREE